MSTETETEAALSAAIQAHYSDEQPGFIATHWIGLVVGVSTEDGVSGTTRFSSDMPHWQHIGLANTLKLQVETDDLDPDDED